MKTAIAPERVLVLKDQLTFEEAKEKAWKKKMDAFGTVSKMTSFLSRPKDGDFNLVYSEHRYQPFWHVVGDSKYVYDRKTQYQWPVSGTEVKKITIEGKDYEVINKTISLEATDHCVQEDHEEVFVDGLNGEKTASLKDYLEYAASVVDKDNLTSFTQDEIIMVPPKARVSGIVREVLAKAIKVIQADQIFEEEVELKNVDLYYRPVYAFQYKWIPKEKEAIVEIDGLTGNVSFGHNLFKEYLGKALDKNFLFDIGADAAGMFIPGGSIAVKMAKKYMESKKTIK
jgi:hypothetical protein